MSTNYMAGLWCFAEASGGIIITGRITALVRSWRFQVIAGAAHRDQQRAAVRGADHAGARIARCDPGVRHHITTQLDQIDSGGSEPLDFRVASERAAQVAEI